MAELSTLKFTLIIRLVLGFVLAAMLFFIPAGTLSYWQAWVYLLIIFGPMTGVGVYLYRRDPELLQRRMEQRETQAQQKLIIALSNFLFVIGFLIPGLDFRYGWSQVPLVLVIVADFAVLAGYLLFFMVIRVNSYASRVVKVEQDQKVITTGPYGVVRHPLYSGWALMLLFTPLALGSFWALAAFIPLVLLLIPRIINEEEVLLKELPGYQEYTQKTRYRLIPYIW